MYTVCCRHTRGHTRGQCVGCMGLLTFFVMFGRFLTFADAVVVSVVVSVAAVAAVASAAGGCWTIPQGGCGPESARTTERPHGLTELVTGEGPKPSGDLWRRYRS